MADQLDVENDPNYILVHNYGFVGLVDKMGDDASICQAARVSYGQGTKSASDDRSLIRYLLRHQHTTPFEMCEVKFHIKLPIFVMRQLIRHRTANVNEYSGRYSEMVEQFYMPKDSYLQPQSKTNKQGREGHLSEDHRLQIRSTMLNHFESTYESYKDFITPYEGDDPALEASMGRQYVPDFPGLTKELARIILPVANYTECYWKMDLHNLLRFLRLRLDPHAQREIVDFAEAIYKLIQPLYPMACEAFEDYMRQAKTFSRMEINLLRHMLKEVPFPSDDFCQYTIGMTKREIQEFKETFNN
jgi:thymidylate synthase (FAD)